MKECARRGCIDPVREKDRRFCSRRCAILHRAARQTSHTLECGRCTRRFLVVDGYGCFCSEVCAEVYEERERQEAARQFNEWKPRAAAAA